MIILFGDLCFVLLLAATLLSDQARTVAVIFTPEATPLSNLVCASVGMISLAWARPVAKTKMTSAEDVRW